MPPKTSTVSRPRTSSRTPKRRDIHSACREIRSGWTEEQLERRTVRYRVHARDRRFAAHLRFVELLLAKEI